MLNLSRSELTCHDRPLYLICEALRGMLPTNHETRFSGRRSEFTSCILKESLYAGMTRLCAFVSEVVATTAPEIILKWRLVQPRYKGTTFSANKPPTNASISRYRSAELNFLVNEQPVIEL